MDEKLIKEASALAREFARLCDYDDGIIDVCEYDGTPQVHMTEQSFKKHIHRLGVKNNYALSGCGRYHRFVMIDGVEFFCLAREENPYA